MRNDAPFLGTVVRGGRATPANGVRWLVGDAHTEAREAGVPAPKRPNKNCPLLGVHRGRAVYLLYNGVLGDKRPAGGNVLTSRVLAGLPPHPEGSGPRIVYGEACRLSEATLVRENVTFRQVPYSLREA